MNWYQHPRTIEALAASYVVGSMSARARRRLERVMAQRPEVADAVSYWADRAMPVALSLPPQTTSAQSWDRLSASLGLNAEPPARAGGRSPAARAASASPSWWQRWFAPIPAGALAMGLVLGVSLPLAWQVSHAPAGDMQLPESYVGVLGTADGKPGLIVSSLRRGTVIDLKVVTPVAVPAGHHLQLWRIDKAGVATTLGTLPAMLPGQKILHMALPEPAEKAFFPAIELAVSIERDGAAPHAPSVPFVYRGLCGKIWR